MDLNLYHQAVQDAALADSGDLNWIEIRGGDSGKFLNGLLTNNIQGLKEKSGSYNLILTPKGKIIADLFCYTCGDHFGIVCNTLLKQKILDTLKRFIVFQKVEIADQSESWGAVTVLGPNAKEKFHPVSKVPFDRPVRDFEYVESSWGDFPLWVIRKKFMDLPSYELWVKRDQLPKLTQALNLPNVDPKTREQLRIESATPLYGVDMNETTIPQEANLYNALSFNKGCYVGQEIVARLEHRGHVGKQLVSLKTEGEEAPPRGEKILSLKGDLIGEVTSSCYSPKYGAPLALGYLRYAFLKEQEVKIGERTASLLPQRNFSHDS